jgi:hypothetical protein
MGFQLNHKTMESNQDIYPVEVFDGNQWEVSLVKSLLENAEIESFLKDERMGVLVPWNVAGGGAGAVKIFVSSADYERAKEVIDQYEKAEGIENDGQL